jgi:chromosome segregation ATPase
MPRNPLPEYFDNVLSSARIVSLIVDQIEAAPAKVAHLQSVLDSVNSQINLTRQSLREERAAFNLERKRVAEADDFSATSHELEMKDLAAQIAEAKAAAVSLQNQAAAEARKLEGIVKEIKKLERQLMFPAPSAGRVMP